MVRVGVAPLLGMFLLSMVDLATSAHNKVPESAELRF